MKTDSGGHPAVAPGRARLERAGFGLLVGLLAPVALYYGLRAAGVGTYPALIAAAAVPALGAVFDLARGRQVEGVMAFFTAMTLLSLGVSLVGGGPRVLLAREGWTTGAAGVWFLAGAWSTRPLALVFTRPLLEGLLRCGLSGNPPARRHRHRRRRFRRASRPVRSVHQRPSSPPTPSRSPYLSLP